MLRLHIDTNVPAALPPLPACLLPAALAPAAVVLAAYLLLRCTHSWPCCCALRPAAALQSALP